jgi:hypothetical protein
MKTEKGGIYIHNAEPAPLGEILSVAEMIPRMLTEGGRERGETNRNEEKKKKKKRKEIFDGPTAPDEPGLRSSFSPGVKRTKSLGTERMMGRMWQGTSSYRSQTNVDLHLDEIELRVGELMRRVLPYAGRRNDAILLFFFFLFFSFLFFSFFSLFFLSFFLSRSVSSSCPPVLVRKTTERR